MNSSTTLAAVGAPGIDVDALAGDLVRIVPRAMRQIRSVARAEASGLSVPQFRAMLWVRRHPDASLSALAEHLGVSLPAASTLVTRLVGGGLVTRTTDPTERRRVRLSLTADGAARVDASSTAVHAWWRGRLADTSDAERLHLHAALDLLDVLLGPDGTDARPAR